jgi:[ribosomal protein S5]-alanine N-acetyltransferase
LTTGARIAEGDGIVLREFTSDDADMILDLVNTPSWLAFIGDRNVRTLEDAECFLLEGPLKSYKENGFGAWCITDESGRRLGSVGIYVRDILPFPDLGFALLPEAEGKGVAFTASMLAIRVATTDYGIKTLSAITDPRNARSHALLIRLGFLKISVLEWPSTAEMLDYWELEIRQ